MDRAGMAPTTDGGGTVLVYAILEATRPFRLPTIRGLEDAELEIREIRGLRVVYSQLVSQPATPDLEQLRAFYEVIERLHARYDILPLRWGQYFSDPQALTCALAADAELYLKRLARLVDATEMGIRFLPTDGQATPEAVSRYSPESRGRAFLEQRRARYGLEAAGQAQRRRVEEFCRNAFDGLFRELKGETAQTQGTDSQAMILVSFLIPRPLVERFRRTYAELRPFEGGRTLLTGPWPPFNFAA